MSLDVARAERTGLAQACTSLEPNGCMLALGQRVDLLGQVEPA